ncbi:MAG: hypothetical protein Q8L89_06770 [Gammaproteobacteria bacterium]|nr:hypothetical protein [Gammaproteobacteria bacterium]
MNAPVPVRLSAADIQNLSSHYLNEGRKQESWQIEAVEINDKGLTAKVSMRTTYVSDTDAKGFHLAIFTAVEFVSQLMVIYMHVRAGLSKKTREVWMLESSTRCVRAIRDPSNIKVEMEVVSMRKRGENWYGVAANRVTDDQGGLFEIKLKGFLS